MRQLFASAVFLLLLTTASPLPGSSITRVEAMLGASGHEYEQVDEDTLKVLISFDDGRSQLVFLHPMSEVRGQEVVEIYSPVMRLPGRRVPAALGERLLRASGSQKIGYFGIEDAESVATVFCYHNLPISNLGANSLSAVLMLVAEVADEMEKEQLGASSDEF
jgi:hypothetical protein